MLYGTGTIPAHDDPRRGASFCDRLTWLPDGEEADAATDYALDGTARSYGTNGDDRRTGQGGDWSPSRSHRWWLIDHRAGLA